MSLDRDAARALFDHASPMPAIAGGAPFASASTFAPAASRGVSGTSTRKSLDWRLIAPVGVAALCAVAVLFISSQRDTAEPGKTVASTEITEPEPAPTLPPPIEPFQAQSAVIAPAASSIVAPPATEPAPAVRTRVRTEPARRAPAPRTIAAAPRVTAPQAAIVVPQPYVAPIIPDAPPLIAATPPIVTPEPNPVTPPAPVEPQPQP